MQRTSNPTGTAIPADPDDDFERVSPDDCDHLDRCEDCGNLHLKQAVHRCPPETPSNQRGSVLTIAERARLTDQLPETIPDGLPVVFLPKRSRISHAVHRIEHVDGEPRPACNRGTHRDDAEWIEGTLGDQAAKIRRFPCSNEQCFDYDATKLLEELE